MKVLVFSVLFVVFGIGIALACDEPPCVNCDQTVNNYETTQNINYNSDDQYRKFRYYAGGDLRFVELNDNAGLELQYRFMPQYDGAKEAHFAGLVAKFDIIGGEK